MVSEKPAQATLFLEYAARENSNLFIYAKNLCHNDNQARELVQEAILKCYEAIERKGFIHNDFSLYLFSQIKWLLYMQSRNKKVQLPLADHLHVGDNPNCSEKIDALALQIDVYITTHFEPRYVSWWQLHLKGVTYEEIGFADGVQKARVCKVINKMKSEVRKEFRQQSLDLAKD